MIDSPRSGRGAPITLFVVSVAWLVSLYDAGFSRALAIEAGAGVLAYAAAAILLGDRLDRRSPAARRVLFFLVQLTLLGVIAWIFVRYRVFGTVWLLHMPLVAQSRMLLPAAGTAAVAVSCLGVLMLHLHALAGWGEVARSFFALSTAIAFVLVFTDIAMRESTARAESQRLSEELEEANRRLGDYAVQAEELSADRERARMAREIHDSVGHSLTALHMQLQAAQAMLERDSDKARDALEKAQRCARDGLNEIRRSVSALRSDPLDGRNLHGALADLAELSTSAGLPVRFIVRGRQRPLSAATTLTLFRSAQEGLTNAKKHARARSVELELDYGERSHDGVKLLVADDGVGSEKLAGGFGLIGLQERARQQGGRLDLVSSPGEGMRLTLELPTPLAEAPREEVT